MTPELVGQPLLDRRRERRAVAPGRALPGQVLEQGLVGGVPGGAGKPGEEVLLLEVELAEVGHGLGVGQDLRVVRKERLHLLLGLDVRLLAGEAEALGVVEVAAGADGEQHVVRLGVFAPEIVRVVGGHDADAQLLAQPEHPLGDQPLLGDPVALDLEPEAVPSVHPREPFGAALGLLVAALPEVQRHLAREARREADDPLAVLLQALLVDSRPPVEPLGVPDGGQPDEVLVAGAVLREQDEVAVGGGRVARLLARLARPEREVGLEAEDRPDLGRLGGVVERPGRVHVAVVGDGQAVHAELLDVRDEIGDPAGPVEQRVFAVGVEMDEGHAYRLRCASSFQTASSGTPRACSSTKR